SSMGASANLASLSLQPGRYPGFALDEPYPDWRPYRRLAFTVVREDDSALELTLRIHDRWHNGEFDDRFNRVIRITPGTQLISIPLEEIEHGPRHRRLDLSQLRGVALFAYKLTQPEGVYLGPVHLE
ncbi:MAG TPA: hypothetical protein VM531_05805, partial [Sphingomicrobium sp.]|nr:hypothetical protein [Sphingomicrobium sp.]